MANIYYSSYVPAIWIYVYNIYISIYLYLFILLHGEYILLYVLAILYTSHLEINNQLKWLTCGNKVFYLLYVQHPYIYIRP